MSRAYIRCSSRLDEARVSTRSWTASGRLHGGFFSENAGIAPTSDQSRHQMVSGTVWESRWGL